VKLSDLIIEHGPYEAGELSPFAGGVDRGDLNELREELLAARAVLQPGHLEVAGAENDVEIICTRGGWHARIDAFSDLAELGQRAGEHAEVCR
jgi:hypothetical protein